MATCECCGQEIKETRFKKPTTDEVGEYCREKGYSVDPELFIGFYESKGWKVGSTKMKDWKAAVRTWERRDGQSKQTSSSRAKRVSDKLNEIARRDIKENGFTEELG